MAEEMPLNNGVDERGIPVKSDYPDKPVPALYLFFNCVLLGIGLAIAYAVYYLGATAKYDAKIQLLASHDLGWVYLGMFVMKLGFMGINMNLGAARKEAKVNVPDQQVYKVHVPQGSPELGYVLMEQEGNLGRFNRAQRALQNFLEQASLAFAYFLLAGFVFPFPAFVAATGFSFLRIFGAIGYTRAAKERMAGTALAGFCQSTLEAFVLIAGFKAVL